MMGLLAVFTNLWPPMMYIFISGDDSFIIRTFQFMTYSDIAHVTNSADFVSCMITIRSWKPTERHWTFSSSWVIRTVTGFHASLACETCKTRGCGTDDFSCRVSFSFLIPIFKTYFGGPEWSPHCIEHVWVCLIACLFIWTKHLT